MRRIIIYYSPAILLLLSFGCAISSRSYKTKNETVKLTVTEDREALAFRELETQEVLDFRAESRGFLFPLIGQAVSMGVKSLSNLIRVQQDKFTAEYAQGLTEMYFYDRISEKGHFDPSGMQFKGFTLLRLAETEKGVTDTALMIVFELDTGNLYELINSSIFRLRVKDIKVNYAKAKVPDTKWYVPWSWGGKQHDNKLNIDVRITFKTSYAARNGSFYRNVETGSFVLPLRNVPLQPGSAQDEFFASVKGGLLNGKSFLIPRSCGYALDNTGALKEIFSQGNYSIDIQISESGKQKFIAKLAGGQSEKILDEGSKKLLDLSKPALGNY